MNYQPKISVIIPIFNTEKYLETCINSLFQQTISDDIEYIFIDDASTDNSKHILLSILSKHQDLHIKTIFNNTNLGSSRTRILGIQEATGEYISFCDSDDWVEPTMMQKLYTIAIQNNSQIVACPMTYDYNRKSVIKHFYNDCFSDLNNQPINTIYFSLCNKIINRNYFLNNITCSYPQYNSWEDLFMTAQAIALSEKTAICNEPLYHYRLSQNNITISSRNHKLILSDLLFYTQKLNDWFKSKGDDFYEKYSIFLLRLKFVSKIKMLRGDTIEITRWKSTFPECNKHIFLLSKQFPLHYRIIFQILCTTPTPITKVIAKILGKNAK